MVTPTVSCHQYDETVLPLRGDPLLAAARLADAGLSDTYVLYESGECWSLALGSLAEITVDTAEVVLTTNDGLRKPVAWQEDPLRVVERLFNEVPVSGWRAYGWAGFELAYANAGQPGRSSEPCRSDEVSVPGADTLLHLVIPETEVRLEAGTATVRGTDPSVLHTIEELLGAPAPEAGYHPRPVEVRDAGCAEYRDAVAAAVREIRDGRLQKVILSRIVPVDDPVDLVGTYVLGRQRNTPARSFLFRMGGLSAAGFSPEIVVRQDATGRVSTQPLAGTRALVGSAERDDQVRADLLSDAKEIFEHAISVKVAYDELVQLCHEDNVTVDAFMSVIERGSVQHLASAVSGQLHQEQGPWQAFGALFPAVTASGVPKSAAYRAIRRHEPHPRGVYGGAVLTVDQEGALDAALALRTIFQRDGRTWLRAGAGIVEQSDPDRELEETCEKLRSVALHIVPASPS